MTGGIRPEVLTGILAFVGLVAAGVTSWVNINQRISNLEGRLQVQAMELERSNQIMTRELVELIKLVHMQRGQMGQPYIPGPEESFGGLPRPLTRGRQ